MSGGLNVRSKRIFEGKFNGREHVPIFCDTETFLIFNSDEEFYIRDIESASVLCYMFGYVIMEERKFVTVTASKEAVVEFLKVLKNLWDKGKVGVLWFHNTSYDILSGFGPLFRAYSIKYKLHLDLRGNGDFLSGGIWFAEFNMGCLLGDTMLFWKKSLSDWGVYLDCLKGEFHYDLCSIPSYKLYIDESIGKIWYISLFDNEPKFVFISECINYLIRDIEIVREIYKKTIMLIRVSARRFKCNYNNKLLKSRTAGSYLRNLFDSLCGHYGVTWNSIYRFEIDKSEYMLQHISNMGGFNSNNREHYSYICSDDEIITDWDFNSMYPSIICKYGVPGGAMKTGAPAGEYVTWYKVVYKKCKWKGCMDVLSNEALNVNKYICNQKEFYIIKELFDFIKDNCDTDCEIKDIRYQALTPFLRDYSKSIWDCRISVKEEIKRCKNPNLKRDLILLEKFFKFLNNQNYGKLCERSIWKNYGVDQSFEILSGNLNYYKKEDETSTYKCLLSGVYITQMGRLILMKKLKQILESGYKVLYCDTDGFTFVHPITADISNIVGVNRDGLGDIKEVGKYHEYHSPGLKKYILINHKDKSKSKIALSGIKVEYQKFLMNWLINNTKEILDVLRIIFNRNCNVKINRSKTASIKDRSDGTIKILEVNVHTNSRVDKTTHELDIDLQNNNFKFIKVDG